MIPELVAYLSDTERLWALPNGYLHDYLMLARSYDGPALEARAPGSAIRADGNVAVLNVSGPIDYRPSIFTALFGGAAITDLRASFQQAMADPGVKAVLFAIDSPGGSVHGVSEMAGEIMAARGSKPVYAQIETMGASAASWLASACDKVFMMPSGVTGALGIITAHADMSGAAKLAGIDITVVSAGEHKGESSPYGPLTADAKAALQERVDAMYAQMNKDVAAGRRVSQAAARDNFGRGRAMNGPQALKAGLVDGLATMDATLSRLTGRKAAGMRAEDEVPVLAELNPFGARWLL